jgi:tRNA-2-methylthio-N6-dimethylallyladenosine synthase
MQGCNNFCTYCVVPYTRGREVSRTVKDIIEEVNVLVGSGVKEIILLGQNVNSYAQTNIVTSDKKPYSFAKLLKRVSEIEGLERLRFTTSNPKDLDEELMKCFQTLPQLCPQFHLPVQSGSNSILSRMNRKYTREKYIHLTEKLRNYCPDIVLTTDIIVGFPGETDEDFQYTMDLLETVRFDGSFSFKYSDRPGTASARLQGKIDEETKSRRLTIFQKRQNEISLEKNSEYIGKTVKVMIEKKSSPEIFQSRSTTNHIVHVSSSNNYQPGDIIEAVIHRAGQHSLQGRAIEIGK